MREIECPLTGLNKDTAKTFFRPTAAIKSGGRVFAFFVAMLRRWRNELN